MSTRHGFTPETGRLISPRMKRGAALGHGWITAMSVEPPLPESEVHGGHDRRPPIWVGRVWDGTQWIVTDPEQ